MMETLPITTVEMKIGSLDGNSYSIGFRNVVNFPDGRTAFLTPQINAKAGDFIQIIHSSEEKNG